MTNSATMSEKARTAVPSEAITAPMQITAVLALIIACGTAAQMAQAQQTGSQRTDLQRHDLSAPGREVIQVRVDFDPGYASPRHKSITTGSRKAATLRRGSSRSSFASELRAAFRSLR